MEASIHVAVPNQDTLGAWEGCGRKGIRRKREDDGGWLLISPDGVVPSWTVG